MTLSAGAPAAPPDVAAALEVRSEPPSTTSPLTRVDALTDAERIWGLSRIWSVARQGFVWFDHVPTLDWDQAYRDALPRVLAARDTAAYYRELMRFTALLGDAHSNAFAPEAVDLLMSARPGLRTTRLEGQVVVTEVRDRGLAEAGVRPGDSLVAIDGVPVDDYAIRHVMPFESSSTPQDLDVRMYDYMLLAGHPAQPVRLDLLRRDGARLQVTAPRSGFDAINNSAPSESFRVDQNGIAVITARQFETDAAARLLDANMDAVLRSKGLVIDLRGNGGGLTTAGYALLRLVALADVPTMRSRVRADTLWSAISPSWQELPSSAPTAPAARVYKGRVAMLIDAKTFSAAEDTAAAFRVMKRGPLVGMATAGSTGQPIRFDLPGGGSARICIKRDGYPDGTDFVGVGVMPDVLVTRTIASIRDGTDSAMESAVALLLEP